MTTGTIGAVVWRYVPAASFDPADSSLLGPGERALLASFRSPLRQSDWLRGRAAAKRLLADAGLLDGANLREVEIVTRDARGRGVPPQVRTKDGVLPVSLSVSHTALGALVACAADPDVRVGVDLVCPAQINPEALSLWLTAAERGALDRGCAVQVAAAWAAKEAIYKAACVDEPFAPLQVEVIPDGNARRGAFFGKPLDLHEFTTWEIDGQVAALATAPSRIEERPACPPGRRPAPGGAARGVEKPSFPATTPIARQATTPF